MGLRATASAGHSPRNGGPPGERDFVSRAEHEAAVQAVVVALTGRFETLLRQLAQDAERRNHATDDDRMGHAGTTLRAPHDACDKSGPATDAAATAAGSPSHVPPAATAIDRGLAAALEAGASELPTPYRRHGSSGGSRRRSPPGSAGKTPVAVRGAGADSAATTTQRAGLESPPLAAWSDTNPASPPRVAESATAPVATAAPDATTQASNVAAVPTVAAAAPPRKARRARDATSDNSRRSAPAKNDSPNQRPAAVAVPDASVSMSDSTMASTPAADGGGAARRRRSFTTSTPGSRSRSANATPNPETPPPPKSGLGSPMEPPSGKVDDALSATRALVEERERTQRRALRLQEIRTQISRLDAAIARVTAQRDAAVTARQQGHRAAVLSEQSSPVDATSAAPASVAVPVAKPTFAPDGDTAMRSTDGFDGDAPPPSRRSRRASAVAIEVPGAADAGDSASGHTPAESLGIPAAPAATTASPATGFPMPGASASLSALLPVATDASPSSTLLVLPHGASSERAVSPALARLEAAAGKPQKKSGGGVNRGGRTSATTSPARTRGGGGGHGSGAAGSPGGGGRRGQADPAGGGPAERAAALARTLVRDATRIVVRLRMRCQNTAALHACIKDTEDAAKATTLEPLSQTVASGFSLAAVPDAVATSPLLDGLGATAPDTAALLAGLASPTHDSDAATGAGRTAARKASASGNDGGGPGTFRRSGSFTALPMSPTRLADGGGGGGALARQASMKGFTVTGDNKLKAGQKASLLMFVPTLLVPPRLHAMMDALVDTCKRLVEAEVRLVKRQALYQVVTANKPEDQAARTQALTHIVATGSVDDEPLADASRRRSDAPPDGTPQKDRGQQEAPSIFSAGRIAALRKALTKDPTQVRQDQTQLLQQRLFRDAKDVGVQNSIEDELLVYQHGRIAALVAKEAALRATYRAVSVSMANVLTFYEGLEVELTCQRCWNVVSDPQIVGPCGLTFCFNCRRAFDEAAGGVDPYAMQPHESHADGGPRGAKKDCACTTHDGFVPNDLVTGVALRWSALENAVTDLEYAVKSVGYSLAPCAVQRSGMESFLHETAGELRTARQRLAKIAAAAEREGRRDRR